MLRAIILIWASVLVGCATVPLANTPSGNPEVTLTNVRPECVRSAFMNLLVNNGYTIRTCTDTQIIAGKTTQNVAASLLLSTRLSGPPEERVTILFIPQSAPDTLRVVVSGAYVSNQGTAFEKVQPVRGSQTEQDQFMAAKSRIEAECHR